MNSFRLYTKNKELAARIADRCAIQRFGLKAKTNFNYTRKDLVELLSDIKHDVDQNIEKKCFIVSFSTFRP